MSFLTRLNVSRPLCSSLFSISRQNGGRDVITRIGVNACSLSSVVEASDLECDEIHEDVKATEKDAALQLAVSQIASEFTKESMLSLKKFFGVRRAPVVSTGSLKLDLALGIGGLPKGRIVEIYGREAAGKTTLALQVIKEAQKLGGYCAFLDVENALDLSLVESIGVNTERLLVSHPDCAENLLSMVNTLTKSGAVDVIVIDSVAALLPKCELDHLTIGGTNRDNLKPLMTKAMRKIHYSLSHSRTLIIFINQVRLRTKSGKANGPVEEVTCGGNALGFHAAVRLRLTRMGLLKTEDKVEGLAMCVQVVKNKLAPSATKKAELGIKFGRGFCLEAEVLELACEHGIIVKQDGGYLIEGLTFNSKLAAEQYLAKSDEILDKLVMDLRRVLFYK